ncbi:MAG: phage tail spike protein [Candidatus Humimicrobiaceae bacterium]
MSEPNVISVTKPIDLVVHKEINGLWSADLTIEYNDKIKAEGYIEFNDELYIVKDFEHTEEGITTVSLDHLMSELNDFSIEAFKWTNVSAKTALTIALVGTTWNVGIVDNLGLEDVESDKRITVLNAISLIITAFNGEIDFHSSTRTVDLKTQIGSNNGIQIRCDKNSDYIKEKIDSTKLVTRLYPYGKDNITINTLIMEECDVASDWTTSDEVNLVKINDSDKDNKKHGSSSLKLTALITNSLNDTVIRDLTVGGEKDLTGYTKIKFWIKASRIGTNLQIGIGESVYTENAHNINILIADTWQEEEWDISATPNASKNAIAYIGLKITNASAENIIYIDCIRAFNGEIYLDSPNIGLYKNIKEGTIFTSHDDVILLKAYAQNYIDVYDESVISYTANTVDLSILPQWTNEIINLGDTVRVYSSKLSLNVDCRVKKLSKSLVDPTKFSYELTNSVENIAYAMAEMFAKLGNAMPFKNDNTAVNAGAVKVGYLDVSVLRANSIFASHYAQLRNVLPYNFDDSLDATYPLECEFYMPPNVDEIKSCWVHIVGRNFRAYSKGAASGGGQTSSSGGAQTSSSGGAQTSSSGSSHNHSVSGQTSSAGSSHSHSVSGQTASDGGSHLHGTNTSSANTGVTSGHQHTYNEVQGYTVAGGVHSHSVTGVTSADEAAHTHSVSGSTSSDEATHTHTVADHTHTVANHTHTVADHIHALIFGIYEDTDPTGVNIYVDNGSGYGSSVSNANTPVSINVNIASSLTRVYGWKKVKITSSRLGRVVVAVILDLTLSSV